MSPFKRIAGAGDPGLTLVELLAVLLILGSFAAWAVSSFRQFHARCAVDGFVTDFVSSLKLARSEAVQRGQRVGLCRVDRPDDDACGDPGGSWHTGWLVFADGNGNRERDAGEPVLFRSLSHATLASAQSKVERPLVFHPSGIAPGTQRTLSVVPQGTPDQQMAWGKRIVINCVGTPRTVSRLDDGD